MSKHDKKQQQQESEDEVAGYDQGREVEFAGDLDAGPPVQAQPEYEPPHTEDES